MRVVRYTYKYFRKQSRGLGNLKSFHMIGQYQHLKNINKCFIQSLSSKFSFKNDKPTTFFLFLLFLFLVVTFLSNLKENFKILKSCMDWKSE